MPDKILIVDDEKPLCDSVVRLLQRKNYDAEAAESGAEALQKLAEQTYDLVLLDIKMPGMNGLEVLRRAKEINPEIMVLFMTGYGTIENAIEALELGALGFVRKPLPIDELVSAIDNTLMKGRLRQENARLRALMPLFDLSKALLSEMDENRLSGLVLDTVITETRADVAQLLLLDEAGRLIIRGARGDEQAEATGEVVEDMANKAISTLEPVISWGNGTEAQEQTNVGSFTGAAYVPLIASGEAIGVLKVAKLDNKTPFEQSDVEFLVTLCGQAAIAIANARLFDDLQRKQQEVEELLKRVINTSDDERLKLSLELHDGPVQTIVASEYSVEASRALIDQNQIDKVGTKLESVQEMLIQSIRDLRRIVRDLHPPALGKSGLVSAIQEYLSNLDRDNGIKCNLEVKDELPHFEPETERGVYYVVREAITNVRKHARATEVGVLVEFQDNKLTIRIIDNGKGFNPAKLDDLSTDHMGMKSMGERAKMLNGNLAIDSKPGAGTKISLVVPVVRGGRSPDS